MANVINATSTGNGGLVSTGDDSGILNIQTNETTAVSVDASQNLTFTNGINAPNTFGFKNRIINGGMTFDQRNGGASVTTATSGAYNLDRWNNNNNSGASRFTVQQTPSATETGYATRVSAGFVNYMACTSTGAYSVISTDVILIRQLIEANNISDLAWGTSGAKTATLSFWVYSSLTGTFGGSLKSSAGGYSYPFTYTINSANTWEQKTITIAGPTGGTWNTGNSAGLEINFGLGVGSTYSGAAGSWSANDYRSATGATNVVGTNGATWYITGVQLEKGTQATSFDFRDYGRELMLCQRYYEKSFDDATAPSNGANGTSFSTTVGVACFNAPHRNYFVTGGYGNWNQVPFKVQKRANPTIGINGNSSGQPFFNAGTSVSGGWGASYGASASNTGWSMSNEYYSGSALVMTWCHWTASAEL